MGEILVDMKIENNKSVSPNYTEAEWYITQTVFHQWRILDILVTIIIYKKDNGHIKYIKDILNIFFLQNKPQNEKIL